MRLCRVRREERERFLGFRVSERTDDYLCGWGGEESLLGGEVISEDRFTFSVNLKTVYQYPAQCALQSPVCLLQTMCQVILFTFVFPFSQCYLRI